MTAALLLCSCTEKIKKEQESFSSVDLIGKWCVDNSQEYWRYDSDGTGLTWDESQDVHEDDETTGKFKWILDGDMLQHIFTGDEVNQAVVQDYTLISLNSSVLRWNDGLKNVTLHKVN